VEGIWVFVLAIVVLDGDPGHGLVSVTDAMVGWKDVVMSTEIHNEKGHRGGKEELYNLSYKRNYEL